MNYIDAFICAVPADNKEAYLAMAEKMAAFFKEQGALRYVECWGDDIPDGQLTSFPLAVKCEPGEVVVMGWAEWPDKAARDACAEAMQQASHLWEGGMPFDGARLIFGGFSVLMEK